MNTSDDGDPGMGAGGTEAITKHSLEAQATDALRDRIITGQLPLGARLVETELAQGYDLSRGTIRAALRRLGDEGLVRQVPYTGYQVMELDDHDLWELATLRGSLERLAAQLSAERIDASGIGALREAYDALQTAAAEGDHPGADRLDHDLHMVIIGLSGNERLGQHYARVQNQFRAYIALSNRHVTPAEIAGSHHALVEAICAGDVTEAGRLAEANVQPSSGMLSTNTPEPTAS